MIVGIGNKNKRLRPIEPGTAEKATGKRRWLSLRRAATVLAIVLVGAGAGSMANTSEASARSDKVSADSTPTTLFESGESSDQATGIGKTTTIPITESTSSSTTTTSESTSSSTTTIPTTESTSSSTTTIPTTESTSSSTTTIPTTESTSSSTTTIPTTESTSSSTTTIPTTESTSSSTTTTSESISSSTTTTIYNSPEPQQPSVAVHTPGEAVTGAGSESLLLIGTSMMLVGLVLMVSSQKKASRPR